MNALNTTPLCLEALQPYLYILEKNLNEESE